MKMRLCDIFQGFKELQTHPGNLSVFERRRIDKFVNTWDEWEKKLVDPADIRWLEDELHWYQKMSIGRPPLLK